MKTFAWPTRLKYAALAALAGWLAGCLVSFPFEFSLAWRYVDGHAGRLPGALAEGLMIWAAFSLFMGLAGFLPCLLPPLLLISPGWIVRRRAWLIPAATLGAILAINARMGLLTFYRFRHPAAVRAFFFTAPNFFVVTFTLATASVYSALAKRRLASAAGSAAGKN